MLCSQLLVGMKIAALIDHRAEVLSYRYDMDFGGFLYSSSAFIRTVALAVARNDEK